MNHRGTEITESTTERISDLWMALQEKYFEGQCVPLINPLCSL